MTKITAEHLARSAIVYVRQSTSYQVANKPARPVEAGDEAQPVRVGADIDDRDR
jgi:hypothetical protein